MGRSPFLEFHEPARKQLLARPDLCADTSLAAGNEAGTAMAVISRGRGMWCCCDWNPQPSSRKQESSAWPASALFADKLHHRSEKENRNLRAIALVHAVSALENHTQHSMNLERFCLKFRDFSNEFGHFILHLFSTGGVWLGIPFHELIARQDINERS